MLDRCLDPGRVNAIVNHDEVRPFVGPGGYLDLSEAIARPENWFLIGEHGGFGLIWSAPGSHEVHTFILKSGRGRWARDAARHTIEYAGANGDAMLWTKIPDDQPNVAMFATCMGMKDAGFAIETFEKPYRIYKMEVGPCPSQQ